MSWRPQQPITMQQPVLTQPPPPTQPPVFTQQSVVTQQPVGPVVTQQPVLSNNAKATQMKLTPVSDVFGIGDGLDGPATHEEIRSWYIYDWANSPYYQVYVGVLVPILLKWLAEGHATGTLEGDSSAVIATAGEDKEDAADKILPGLGITAGSYPLAINFITIALQTLSLLFFASLGDYINLRKKLLTIFMYIGAFFVFLNIFCFSISMWWFAGLIRIIAGIAFVMAGVYYNAFLPLLAAQHEDMAGVPRNEREDKVEEFTDALSNQGFLIGYAGGTLMLFVSYFILKFFQCDRATNADCTEFGILFPPCLCIGIVGLWWAIFGTYTVMKLKTRPGSPLPAGSYLCMGIKETCATLGMVRKYKNTMMFLIAFFLYSDAMNTTCSVAVLILEDEGDAGMAAAVMAIILATVASFAGGIIIMSVQKCYDLSAKGIMIFELCVFMVVCLAALCGLVTAFDGFGYYLCLGPAVLVLGSLQAYSRSLFSLLTPVGKEASMFAFFEITDKGSNLIGTFVALIVHNTTKSYMGTFWYLIVAFTVSIILLCLVDVDQGMIDAGKGTEDPEFLMSEATDEEYE